MTAVTVALVLDFNKSLATAVTSLTFNITSLIGVYLNMSLMIQIVVGSLIRLTTCRSEMADVTTITMAALTSVVGIHLYKSLMPTLTSLITVLTLMSVVTSVIAKMTSHITVYTDVRVQLNSSLKPNDVIDDRNDVSDVTDD